LKGERGYGIFGKLEAGSSGGAKLVAPAALCCELLKIDVLVHLEDR